MSIDLRRYAVVNYNRQPKDGENGKDGAPGKDGTNGKDALMLVIDPPTITVEADANGTVSMYPGQYSLRANVRSGSANESGWTFSAVATSGLNFSLTSSTGSGGLTSMTADSGTITITASKAGYMSLTATLVVTKVKNGATGARGCFPLPPKEWTLENYPIGYVFQGYQDNGATHIDCALIKNDDGRFNVYVCKVGYTQTTATIRNAPNTMTGNWEPAYNQAVDILASRIFLAYKAYIDLISTNGIRIYNKASKIVGQLSSIEGCPESPASDSIFLPFFIGGIMSESGLFSEDPKMAVDTLGTIYSGGVSGRHIEISAVEKAVKIFDENGALCAIHSGRKLSVADVTSRASSGETTKSGAANILPFTRYTGTQSGSEIYSASKVIPDADETAANSGELQVTVPSFKLEATKATRNGLNDAETLASITLYLDFVIDGEIKRSYFIGEADTPTSQNYISTTTASKTFTCPIVKGQKYHFNIRAKVNMLNSVLTTQTGEVTVNINSASITTLKYLLNAENFCCEYGANGFFIMTNTQNYIYVIFDDNKRLNIKAVANGNPVF